MGFSEALVNVYFQGVKINLRSSSIDTTRAVLGAPSKSVHLGGNEHGDIYQDIFSEVAITYYQNSGRVLHLVLTGQSASIEFGAKVGDSVERIAVDYADGFYFAGEDKKGYRYLTFLEGAGFGYSFHLENDTVTSIEIGSVPLGK